VNDNKEEFGVQLIPNQYAKGGRMSNTLKLEDYETASMSAGGYEEQMIVPQSTTGIYKEGGGVDNVMKKKVKSYEELQNHPLVDSIEREYNAGAFDGTDYTYWLYLKDGYMFESLGTTSLHEGFKKDLIRAFNEEEIVKTNQFKEGGGVDATTKYKVGDKIKSFEVKRIVDGIAVKYDSKGRKTRYVTPFLLLESDNGQQRILRADKTSLNDAEQYYSTFARKNKFKDWQMFDSAEKFEGGGDVRDFDWYKGFKKDQLKKGTEHEMEHIDTIRDFKKEGVSDREVAEAIAKDHLEEDENYYIELDKMESARKLSQAIQEFEKYKGYRKNARKFKHGGYMGDSREIVHVVFTNDFDGVIRDKDGNYVGESKFPKDALYKFRFKHNDGRNSTLEFANTGAFLFVPNSTINIVGFDERKFGNGGSVKPYQSIPATDNDKQILKLLTKYEDPMSLTSNEKQRLSSFKGNNVVNELSSSIIQKIYGLLFEYHNIENPIKHLFLSNVGAGNILSYAPNYLDKTMISFDDKNRFVNIEKEINSIINTNKHYILYDVVSLRDMDAIIHVYPNTNPEYDELNYLLYQTNKSSIALGVCEFTSRERLNEFQQKVVINQGAFAQNQMMLYKEGNKYLIVNEGITDEGQYTLIYVLKKMF
jgi:hypothetical protein